MNAAQMESPESQLKPHLVLVDGSGYIFRAYHALPPLTRSDGTPTGAVYGFTTMLLRLRDELKADYFAVIFDAARKTFRHTIYADYKANRSEPPEDLVPQFALVREAAHAMQMPAIEKEDYEADDLIAAYAKAASAAGMRVTIISSDKDLMQLINDDVQLFDPMKNKPLGAEAVMEKFGVLPHQVIEVQALIGDSVDNVPGVPGIGPKTAAQLIEEYGTLEAILEAAPDMKPSKRRDMLIEHAGNARLSYHLVQLDASVPLPLPIEALIAKPMDKEAFLSFLQLNEFRALIKKFGGEQSHSQPVTLAPKDDECHAQPLVAHYTLIEQKKDLQHWIDRAMQQGFVAVDTETTGLDAMRADLVGISLALAPGEACYIPLAHGRYEAVRGAQGGLFDAPDMSDETQFVRLANQLPISEVLAMLSPLFSDVSVVKVGQNIKYDALILARYGVQVTPVDDTMLLSYTQHAGLHPHNLDELAERYCQHRMISFAEVTGKGKQKLSFAEVPLEQARDYAAEDADFTLRLYQQFKPSLVAARLCSVYETIERPLIPVMVAMERAGIKVSQGKLNELSQEFAGKIEALEQEIYGLAGRPFNVGSPKQLGEILFDEQGLGGGKKSAKSGAYATGVEVLEELAAQGHTLPARVLDWRQLSKLKSTYTDALARAIHPETGRVHTSFSMAATTTGRLSSSDPNLQNIPVRTQEGKRIREAFIAEEGYKLISADYSQIELRLLAHIADIDVLKQAFRAGADIHAATASQMFGVAPEKVDGELRRRAKTINFGIIYGISAHGLASRLGISRSEAADYIAAYFKQYPGIQDYMERCKIEAREQGYVSTLFGRRVHVKDIRASNPNLRAFSERAAINAPLQGTAADIIKRAMVKVYAMLAEEFPKSRLLLQVHDELIIEAPEAEAEQVAKRVQSMMSDAASLAVPLQVDAGVGDHWGAIH